MVFGFLSALGGVGLFLIGMLLLTDSLKEIAGQGMRHALARFTSTPLTGAATGALSTAVIQSSSATTVAAVGFVASGLLTFPQALGVIFGANIGTTVTGWFVAVLGFKLDLGQIALPFVFLGALMRIAFRGRTSLAGSALAGFCLIFIGIEHMKTGLDAFGDFVTPTDFPQDTIFGRLQLVGVGVLITLLTQSSSAGVATALAALGAGAISFPQAAALVIGMDVGTTFTAALATLGGGTMARRTGFAHVIYNVLTGTIAFLLLGPFTFFVKSWLAHGDALLALVAFHTFFNVLGVILVLPFAGPFAKLVAILVPERGAALTRSLDPLILGDARTAVALSAGTVDKLADAVAGHLDQSLDDAITADTSDMLEGLTSAVAETRAYLDRIELPKDDRALLIQQKHILHCLDHLDRLLLRSAQSDRIAELSRDHRLRRLARLLHGATSDRPGLEDLSACARKLDRLRKLMRGQRRTFRDRLITEAARGLISTETAGARLDALRWLHRVTYHLWRIRLHRNALTQSGNVDTSAQEEARIDVEQE